MHSFFYLALAACLLPRPFRQAGLAAQHGAVLLRGRDRSAHLQLGQALAGVPQVKASGQNQ
jgi:hypothetical protein